MCPWAPQSGRGQPLLGETGETAAGGAWTLGRERWGDSFTGAWSGETNTTARFPHVWVWSGGRAPENCVEVPALIRCAAFIILSLGFLFVNEYKYHSHLPVGLLWESHYILYVNVHIHWKAWQKYSMEKVVGRYVKILWGGSADIFHSFL